MIIMRTEGFLYLIAFMACIPIANWMIGNVGTTCIPNGPCLVPVAPGLMAPSGVVMVGLALVLRDPLQRRRFVTAVIASSMVGLVVDSIIFLWLAFNSLEFLWGQVIGKAWMVLISLPFIHWLRIGDSRMGQPVPTSAPAPSA